MVGSRRLLRCNQKSLEHFHPGLSKFHLGTKAQECQKELKIWLVQSVYNLGKEKDVYIKTLETLQDKMEQGNITRDLLIQEKDLDKKMQHLAQREEEE